MKTEQQLATIRELTVSMAPDGVTTYTDRDRMYLRICEDILRQVRADGSPGYPIVEFIEREYGVDFETAIEAARDANA